MINQVSHYRILEKIGSGGMGVVYKAEDTRLGRTVALKFLPTELTGDAMAKARFIQEGRAAATLDHPNICTVYDIGETDEGQLFIAMAYYRGETLKARLAQGALPVEEAIDLTVQIAQGLARAHAHGVVHRDIKPANVIVTDEGVAKVVDFGIAKLPDVTSLTMPGMAWGTISYMAPEQIRGGPVDHRADVWALGALLYEMLAGRPAFQADRAEPALHAVLHTVPDPLPQVRPGIPGELAEAVGRALMKDAARRYQSVGELAAALKSVQRRLQGGTPAAAERKAPSIAVLPFSDMSPARDQEYFCDGIAEELITTLARLRAVRVASRTSSFQFKGQAADVREIAARLNVDTVLAGSVRKAGTRLRISVELVNSADGYHLWSERYDRELDDIFAIQDDIARAIIDQLEVTLVGSPGGPLVKRQTDDLEAYNLYLQGRYYWARRYPGFLQKALRAFEQAIELDPAFAAAHAGLADAYNILGFYGLLSPADALAKAREAADRAMALDDGLAEAHQARGFAFFIFEWNYDAGEREYRRAIALNPDWAFARTQLGWWLCWLGRFEEGLTEARLARDLEPGAPLVGMYGAAALYDARRYEEALAECQRVSELDPSFVVPMWLDAWIQAALGNTDAAVRSAEKAVDLARRQSFYLGVLGQTYARAARRSDAEAIRRELADRAEREYVSPLLFAQISAALGEIDATLAWLERAVEARAALVQRVAVDPLFDGVRADARFVALLDRVGLAHVQPPLA